MCVCVCVCVCACVKVIFMGYQPMIKLFWFTTWHSSALDSIILVALIKPVHM